MAEIDKTKKVVTREGDYDMFSSLCEWSRQRSELFFDNEVWDLQRSMIHEVLGFQQVAGPQDEQ